MNIFEACCEVGVTEKIQSMLFVKLIPLIHKYVTIYIFYCTRSMFRNTDVLWTGCKDNFKALVNTIYTQILTSVCFTHLRVSNITLFFNYFTAQIIKLSAFTKNSDLPR